MSDTATRLSEGYVSLSAPLRPSSVLWRVFAEAGRHQLSLWLTVGTTVGLAVATLLVPRLIGHMVDQVAVLLKVGAADVSEVRTAILLSAGLVIAATALRGLLSMASAYLGERLSQLVALELRLRYFDKLQRLSFAFHDKIHSGDLITRGMLDLEGMRAFIQAILLNALPLVLLVGFAGAMMAGSDPMLAAVSLGFVPVAGWALARSGVRLRRTWFQVQALMSHLTLVMEENLQGVRVVRAFAAEGFELGKFDEAAGSVLRVQFQRITLRFVGLAWMTTSFHLSLGLLLWMGGRKVMAGEITVGRLAEFVAYLTALQGPIRQISMIFNVAARAASAGGRVFEIFDLPPDVADRPDARPLGPDVGALRFDNVSFRYDPNGPDVLHEIDFEVRAGRIVGLVGAPGSGKSTIASLIPRFYDVTSGAITIDGVDIRKFTLESLRRRVGVVQQEAFLFDSPIGHNLAYADPWAPDDRIVEASSAARLHEHIETLPAQYETRVGERGVSLSGGQRQRASIARGVLPGPGILVLDDSTAAIDSITETQVRDGLARLASDKAIIIIAHRLSSLMHADEILVLEEGRVIERGDHAALLAREGLYAQLYAMQSRQARDGVRSPAAALEQSLASA